MAVLGGVNRHRSSEGTLSQCPGFARFAFGDLGFGASGLYGDSATGVGDWSRIGGNTPSIDVLGRQVLGRYG